MRNLNSSTKKHINSYIDSFIEYLRDIKGYSKLTLKTYKEALQEAFDFIEIERNGKNTECNLMPYRLHIANKSPKTISKKLSAIRSFATYLNEHNFPCTLLADESIKVPKTLPKPISYEHIKEALEYAEFEERFIIIMIYTLGLRISELSDIKLEDISKEWIRIRGKGNKERDVPLLDSTRKLIDTYIEQKTPKRYLFEKNGQKLSQNSLRYLINKTFAKIGLKVTPHQLRHSFATSLLNSGAAIADVSELLGHASMATTQIYTKLGSTLKKENYTKSHPLCLGEI
ncbi:Tyrosine recombinase XerC [hydrothermal vent metagenome]|uniref:Tyrosine recombinase XerC n=1 Tax=hydrothermal vent metagenome TaxID=652676 RepID=A0A1W1BG58_9ZZZZ